MTEPTPAGRLCSHVNIHQVRHTSHSLYSTDDVHVNSISILTTRYKFNSRFMRDIPALFHHFHSSYRKCRLCLNEVKAADEQKMIKNIKNVESESIIEDDDISEEIRELASRENDARGECPVLHVPRLHPLQPSPDSQVREAHED